MVERSAGTYAVLGAIAVLGAGFAFRRCPSPQPAVSEVTMTASESTPPSSPASGTAGGPAPASAPSATEAGNSALGTERAALDRARDAIENGRPSVALVALREQRARAGDHARLAEERDALEVQALARDGQLDSARAAAERFRARYPTSRFSSAVDSIEVP